MTATISVTLLTLAISLSAPPLGSPPTAEAPAIPPSRTHAGVELLATASLPWDARDRSGLSDTLTWDKGSMPHDRLGSFGSALTYSGRDDLYYACADRGPADGAAAYHCRMHILRLGVTSDARGVWSATMSCEATRLLRTESGAPLIGLASAINANAARALRFDPEGIRVGHDGSIYISDEYGPFIDHFSADGVRLARLPAAPNLLNPHPSGEPAGELPPFSLKGRQPNRGMEGLAISPEGLRLFGIMQSPLIQDAGLDAANKRIGMNARIIEYSLRDGARGPRRQFVYRMERPSHSLNEILAVSDRSFLVLERDGKGGDNAAFRSIYLVTLDGATDVSTMDPLPVTASQALPSGVRAVTKTLLLDLMRPEFGLAGDSMPEKIEGLTFGPDLPDGRRLLLISIDNDFLQGRDNIVWCFAIDPAKLPDYVPQLIATPPPDPRAAATPNP